MRPSGALEYRGERPGPGWHVHGWLGRWLHVLEDGELRRLRLFKRRWYNPQQERTVHSRPPDDLGAVHYCALIIAVMLWTWLDGRSGLHRSTPVLGDLREGKPSDRSVQRWLGRATDHADEIQQRVRSALLERCEPRPIEKLFPRGLSPPDGLTRRRWQAHQPVARLWRALAILFVGATSLEIPTAALLAEARGR
jgi:hypothetical protein